MKRGLHKVFCEILAKTRIVLFCKIKIPSMAELEPHIPTNRILDATLCQLTKLFLLQDMYHWF